MKEPTLLNRDISWLSFNYRVLQEAMDSSVPLFERLKFLAIYSSNLDEFFRVRVAGLRSILNISKKSQRELDFEPEKVIKEINRIVNKHQDEIWNTFRNKIIPQLKENKIILIDETQLTKEQKEFTSKYFEERIVPQTQPILIVKNKIVPFLRNRRLYLAVKMTPMNNYRNKPKKKIQYKYAIVEIPTNHLPRFVQLPSNDDNVYLIFLDDIIRLHINTIFLGYEIVQAYSIKLIRDAELYIEDEFSGNLFDKIKKSLLKRSIGAPSRFLFDQKIPTNFLKILTESFKIDKNDLAPRGKYLSLSDFFSFPNPKNQNLYNEPLPAIRHNELDSYPNIFDAISEKDFVLHFPYHTYDHVLEFLGHAAQDPNVTDIYITQYRVAKDSEVISTLVEAVRNNKNVMVFVELKARFDEESNIHWAEEMKEQGIKVLYSFPGLKVHAKLALVIRKEKDTVKKYCYLATGNFNEKTAQLYSDTGLLTTNPKIINEVKLVFDYLENTKLKPKFKNILVAMFNMRKTFLALIDNEIAAAKEGNNAEMILKMNSLEDTKMIQKLYEASNAGVKIQLIIRGICCLIPGQKGLSENINVISIVDRYLEHSRIFIFYNGGNYKIYAGSADWMRRNLSRRIEVISPILDENIKQEILDIINIQLNDNVKARIIDKKDRNNYKSDNTLIKHQSQIETYNYLKLKYKEFKKQL